MSFRYLPTTKQDREEMLKSIGVSSVEELFAEIPQSLRFQGSYQLAGPLSELDLLKHMKQLAARNQTTEDCVSFLGAGVYQHHIPSVVNHVISRSEFYTAYTPYQPEISQGELQGIFEFQTMIAELTGMDVANSSMYDGATALAEAANVASAVTRRKKVIISGSVHPESRAILQTTSRGFGLEIVEIPVRDGITDVQLLEQAIDHETAAVIMQYPNFYGNLESLQSISEHIHAHKGLLVVSSNPMALAILQPPGKYGADMVVGDAQPFGIPMAYGGPHCGYFTTTKALMRRIPGRIVGQTVDEEGRRGFVLTLQAREQHIRRDKATSNICSNQALNALAASVYLSALGKEGLRQVSKLNYDKAHYAKEQLAQVKGVTIPYKQPFFNEFVVELSKPAHVVVQQLLEQQIIVGLDLGRVEHERANQLLINVTEMHSIEDIDRLVSGLEA